MNTDPLRQSPWIVALLVTAGLLAACGPEDPASESEPVGPNDTLLQGTFWRTQGTEQIMPAWTDHAQTHEGLYYAELDRDWTPQDTVTQYPGMLARHLFSHSAAYLMSGQTAHLEQAETIVDFLVEHGWDETYGGWYNAVSRDGEVVDDDKDLFMQIYATTGLALYAIATRDSVAQTYLERSREFMMEHAWDTEHGGYVDVLNRDGSIKSDLKDFSPQLAPLSGYLLYLYPATRDSSYLQEAERIMDLTLTHMQDERGWIRERFARDWTFLPDDGKNSHINVGHNAEVAWLLLRLHALTGNDRYRKEGLALTDQLLEQAFREDTGAWVHKLERTDPTQHRDEAVWWVQAYGNMLQLYAHCTTGEERYLDAFRKGAQFWNEAFVDDEHGGTVLKTTLDGTVTRGAKAVRTKTSYHTMEHALLCSLYLDLWANNDAATLHYRVRSPRGRRLHPLPIEATAQVTSLHFNGAIQPSQAIDDGTIRLPDGGPVEIDVSLTSSSFSQ